MRSQYSVYLVSDSSTVLQSANEIENSGYNLKTLSLMKGTLDRIKSDQPDVIVLDTSTIEGGASLYAERVQAACSNSIILSVVESVDEGLSLKGQVYDFLLRPFVRAETLLMMIDKACEKLYFEYQVSRLIDGVHKDDVEKVTSNEVVKDSAIGTNSKTVDIIDRLEVQPDSQAVIKVFLESFTSEVEKKPLLFFKYLPSHQSMGLAQCGGLSIEKIRGIGVGLKKYTPGDREHALYHPMQCPELTQLMHSIFANRNYVADLLVVDGKPYGWMVKLGDFASDKNKLFYQSMIKILSTIIENKVLKFRLHNVNTQSAETGLSNRTQFYRILRDEVARSRRTHLPNSLIMISIDQFKDYERANGAALTKRLRKSMADLLFKTSRITDLAIDLMGGEFALVMPHTDQKGAAIKAEKLRRVFASSQFPGAEKMKDSLLSLSIGVSEYPGFCGDADALMKTADDALFYIKNAGGNRVCLAEKPENFEPDFEARSVPR